MLDKDYERIYAETHEFTRADFVKRIKELEEINEEHRKLNAELNQEIKELKNIKVTEEELDKLNREFYGFTMKQLDDDLGRYAIRFSDLEKEKQQLISFLEDKIKRIEKKKKDSFNLDVVLKKGKIFAYREVLSFITGEVDYDSLNETVEFLEENDEWEDIKEVDFLDGFNDSYYDTCLMKMGKICNQLIKNQKYLKERLENKESD